MYPDDQWFSTLKYCDPLNWGLFIRTPYNQVNLVIRTGLSPYNEALADLAIWTAEKVQLV